MAHEQYLEQHVDASGEQRSLNRRGCIAAGIERRSEAAQQNEGKQPERIGGKRRSGSGGILRSEGAALEQRAHDEVGNDDGADGARNGEEERKLHSPPLRRSSAPFGSRREPAPHLRQ